LDLDEADAKHKGPFDFQFLIWWKQPAHSMTENDEQEKQIPRKNTNPKNSSLSPFSIRGRVQSPLGRKVAGVLRQWAAAWKARHAAPQ
jgi:hypothetical protein